MKLPDTREFEWALKSVDTAHTEQNKLPSGQIEMIIKHATVKGITTDMLLWWFTNFANLFVTVKGQKYPAYHLWHPLDHISVKIKNETLKQGDNLHIQEAFQRDSRFLIDDEVLVAALDTSGIELQGYKLGLCMMQLRHDFKDIDGGVAYSSRMVIGLEKGLLKGFINSVVIPRKFSKEKATAWLRHNVEEVGCFENFLKKLYQKRNDAPAISMDK